MKQPAQVRLAGELVRSSQALCLRARALIALCAGVLALQFAALCSAAVESAADRVTRVDATVGKSVVLQLPAPVTRIAIADPAVADVILLGPQEIYLLGKSVGTTNVTTWGSDGVVRPLDVAVGLDAAAVRDQLRTLLPDEHEIEVVSVGTSLVVRGRVADALRAQQAVELAQSFGAKRTINLLRVRDPQQVMLEVKVAEVSRTLLEKLGIDLRIARQSGGTTLDIVSTLLSGSAGVLSARRGAGTQVVLDAEDRDGLIKILAEPTILAISGQEGSFLAGGRIFIPIPQGGAGATASFTLQEKEFGVRLRFLPTVLENGKIHLKVTPEVSEVSQTGIRVSSPGIAPSVIPAITTREVSTTVQLHDGESLAIGGLIRNNSTANVRAFPILGELPIIGALFRSTEFLNDRTELLFVVTPRLVAAGRREYPLPTDAYREPGRRDLHLDGRLERGNAVPAEAHQNAR